MEGRATTDLTFILNNLQEQLYNCPDKFNVLDLEPDALNTEETVRAFSNPTVNINGETFSLLTREMRLFFVVKNRKSRNCYFWKAVVRDAKKRT